MKLIDYWKFLHKEATERLIEDVFCDDLDEIELSRREALRNIARLN